MKDVVEAAFLFAATQASPLAIALALVGISFFFRKQLQDVDSQRFAVHEKKLSLLLEYVNGDIKKKHPFTVEQVFMRMYRKPLKFNEIAYLLEAQAPSDCLQKYVWAHQYVQFDARNNQVILRADARIESRSKQLQRHLWTSYIGLNVALLGVFAFYLLHAGTSPIASMATAAGILGIFFGLTVIDLRAVNAAKSLSNGIERSESTSSAAKLAY